MSTTAQEILLPVGAGEASQSGSERSLADSRGSGVSEQ